MREDTSGGGAGNGARRGRGRISRARAFKVGIRALCWKLVAAHVTMDVLPSGNLFRELQDVTDTGYFEWKLSLEDYWQQVSHAERPWHAGERR